MQRYSKEHTPGRPVGRTAAARATDAVVLVPGFFGFGRIGRFYYFSERIAAALRGVLEARLGRPVVVVASWSRPTDGLAIRQEFLLEQLAALAAKLPRLRRVHLVGHSTGGVDAQLLTCDRPLADRPWRHEHREIRHRVASVVAISAPHHGTFLASSLGARFVAHPLRYLRGLRTLARLALDVVPVAVRHPDSTSLLGGLRQQLPETLAFLQRVIANRDLVDELTPEAMAALRARVRPEGRAPLTSFVSVAALRQDAPTPPAPLFRDLYGLVARSTAADHPVLVRTLARLRAYDHLHLIAGDATIEPRQLGPEINDGLASTGLQLLDPDDPAELGGVVVGDHGDVLGHYDRRPALLEALPLDLGLFHSGSGFNDDAFFELYGRVAAAILRSIPDLPPAPPAPPP